MNILVLIAKHLASFAYVSIIHTGARNQHYLHKMNNCQMMCYVVLYIYLLVNSLYHSEIR